MFQELKWILECELGITEGLVTSPSYHIIICKEAPEQGNCHPIEAHKPREDSVLANYVKRHAKILHHCSYRRSKL